LLQGAPITNPNPLAPAPADAHVVAEGQLNSTTGTGNVQANLGLTASFKFRLVANEQITIRMDSNSHLVAFLQAGERGTARASEQWVIDVSDSAGTEVFSWQPDGTVGTGIKGTGAISRQPPCY
jgi:hypothetical protein